MQVVKVFLFIKYFYSKISSITLINWKILSKDILIISNTIGDRSKLFLKEKVVIPAWGFSGNTFSDTVKLINQSNLSHKVE